MINIFSGGTVRQFHDWLLARKIRKLIAIGVFRNYYSGPGGEDVFSGKINLCTVFISLLIVVTHKGNKFVIG